MTSSPSPSPPPPPPSTGVPVWPRPFHEPSPSTPPADIALFLFSQAPDGDPHLPLRTRAHGVPEGGLSAGLDVRTVARAQAPDWVEGFFSDALMTLATNHVGWQGRPPVEPTLVHVVRVTVDDPTSLSHLQSAWALARAFADTGAFALLDAHAHRWVSRADLARRRPDGPFRFADEVTVVFETEPTSTYGHIAHTRGMAKFGRPDLIVTAVPPKHGAAITAILSRLGERLALGALLDAGDAVELEGLGWLRAEALEAEVNAPELNLNNPGLVLRPLPASTADA